MYSFKTFLLLLSASTSFVSAVDIVKPPPAACTPRQALIDYIIQQPDGRAFCTSLNIKPRVATSWVYNGTATVTAPVESAVIVTVPVAQSTYFTVTTTTVTAPGVSITSNYNVTKSTARSVTKTSKAAVVETVTSTATVTYTFTPGVTPSSSGTGIPSGTGFPTGTGTSPATYSTGTGTGITYGPIGTSIADLDLLGLAGGDSNMVFTVTSPASFPVPTSLVKRHLKHIRRKELKKRATSPVILPTGWPFYSIVNDIPSDAFETACDCIVGVPTSTKTTFATGTNYITYINTGSTSFGTVTFFRSAPDSTIASPTITETTIPTIVITMTRTVSTVWSTTRTTTTATATSTSTVTAYTTTTVYPACATGYAENGYVGTGNRVELVQAPGPDAAKSCCERCQKTDDCVANVYVGFMCQLLINEEVQDGEKAVGYCPKGIEQGFVFGTESGRIRKGPCAGI